MSVGNFHNFHNLIARHKRTIEIAHWIAPYRDEDTTRAVKEGWEDSVTIEGALWYATYRDLKRYPNFELTGGELRLTTSTNMLNDFELRLKDKIEFEGKIFFIKHIIKQTHYGNFLIAFLSTVNSQL